MTPIYYLFNFFIQIYNIRLGCYIRKSGISQIPDAPLGGIKRAARRYRVPTCVWCAQWKNKIMVTGDGFWV